ncbi:hypothetical protein ASG52_24195 [Methylobacterium sp. Leaf456]|uniref:hypothetical protein n=1 Tax=Methylobacterium sp. Leaf456 TaxID=1736382 RepID=UPI0006FFB916|nr:hypothetical protein [Methylobacterium sp. Leaf456]KQT56179.1 hypothetical protein ASG52_24195 [Methylobacterium sp. Leaf456]
MLTILLAVALAVVLGLIVVRQRNLGFLMSLGSLIAAVLMMIWMQNMGLLPGSQGPYSDTRPPTLLDGPKTAPETP